MSKNSILKSIFSKKLRYHFVISGFCGLISSMLFTGLLMMINHMLSGSDYFISFAYDSLIFASMLAGSYFFSHFFQSFITRATQRVIFEFEIDFLERLRQTSYQDLEKLGNEKVYNALGDTKVIGEAPATFVGVFNALVVILCCLVYTFIVSFASGLAIAILMGLMFIVYYFRNRKLIRQMNLLRDIQNDFVRYLQDLLYGFNQIKMNTARNNTLFNDYIKANRKQSRDLAIDTQIRHQTNELSGSFFWYVLIGIIIYALPVFLELGRSQVTSIVLSIFYLFGPIAVIIQFIFTYNQIKIAFERITAVQQEISLIPIYTEENEREKKTQPESLELLSCNNLRYYYTGANHETEFLFGPINLGIAKGEVIFVTGGNGSGKSTFINLITGLYKAEAGTIHYNGIPVDAANQCWYSNKITAVFCDCYLLSENYDNYDLTGEKFRRYVDLMRMNETIKVDTEKNRLFMRFSKGQQKRVALMYSLMDDREIIVLDEWAAEQDPEFRNFFYTRLIPMLKQKGKTIIAVTHDDDYFHCADRILKFEYGKLASDIKTARLQVAGNT